MNAAWCIRIPDLTVDLSKETGLIELRQQQGLDDPDFIELHPMHVRMLAERCGLLAAPAPDAGPGVDVLQEQLKIKTGEIDHLKRSLLRLREHALQVHKAMTEADWDHADLTFEMGQVNTMVDLCDMAVDDFVDDYTPSDPDAPAGAVATRQRASGVPRDKSGTTAGQPRGTAVNPAASQRATQQEPSGFPNTTFQWAMRQKLEKSSTKFVLTAMAAKVDDKDRCALTTQELAELTGQDRKTVLENIKRLSEIGLIVDTGEREGASKAVPVFLLATEKEYEPGKSEQLQLAPGLEDGE